MARQSSIKQLPNKIQAEVDKLIREGKHTIDDIVQALQAMGGDASRSAVGRYVKSAKEKMERFAQAQEVAKVWVDRLEDNPHGDVGRLISEMLRTVAFQTISTMGDDDASVNPGHIMFLAKAIKDLSSADKISVDREIKIRDEIKAKAEQVAEQITIQAKRQGLSDEAAQEWRNNILGISA